MLYNLFQQKYDISFHNISGLAFAPFNNRVLV